MPAAALSGDLMPAAALSGDLMPAAALSGNLMPAAALSGDLMPAAALSGDLMPAAALSGDLMPAAALSGDLMPAAALSGDLMPAAALSGDLMPAAALSGDLMPAAALSGDLMPAAALSGDLMPRFPQQLPDSRKQLHTFPFDAIATATREQGITMRSNFAPLQTIAQTEKRRFTVNAFFLSMGKTQAAQSIENNRRLGASRKIRQERRTQRANAQTKRTARDPPQGAAGLAFVCCSPIT